MVATAVIFSSAFPAMFGTFVKHRFQNTYDAILAAPVDVEELVTAEMLWIGLRAGFFGCFPLLVAMAFGLDPSPGMLLVPFFCLVTALGFAGFGIAVAATVAKIDQFNYVTTLFITPLFLVAGTFFPIDELPQRRPGGGAAQPAAPSRRARPPRRVRLRGDRPDPVRRAARARGRHVARGRAADVAAPDRLSAVAAAGLVGVRSRCARSCASRRAHPGLTGRHGTGRGRGDAASRLQRHARDGRHRAGDGDRVAARPRPADRPQARRARALRERRAGRDSGPDDPGREHLHQQRVGHRRVHPAPEPGHRPLRLRVLHARHRPRLRQPPFALHLRRRTQQPAARHRAGAARQHPGAGRQPHRR